MGFLGTVVDRPTLPRIPWHIDDREPRSPLYFNERTVLGIGCLYHPRTQTSPRAAFQSSGPNLNLAVGRFSNPAAAIRALPLVVRRSLPSRSAMYPSMVSRSSCSKGILAAHVSPTLSSEANSSRVSVCNSESIIRVWHFFLIDAWSILLRFGKAAVGVAPFKSIFMYRSRNGSPRESWGLRQWRRENAMRGKLIKFQSESVMAYVCLGVTVASLYTLVGMGLIIVFM
jgi:hypothetical protein